MATVLGDRFELLECLGRGGMAEVYRARDRRLGRDVAIKLLNAACSRDPSLIERFRQESSALAQLSNPRIVTLLDAGETADGRFYLVMERLRGEGLDALFRRLRERTERMPWRRLSAIVRQICAALHAAHARQIVHRDIKPSNLYLLEDTSDGEDFIKILDFGIAKILASAETQGDRVHLTASGMFVGTPHYAAPEAIEPQMYGHVGAQVDVYALGVILYQGVAGVLPHEGEPRSKILYKTAFEEPPPLRARVGGALAPEVEAVVMRAIARRPELRFASVRELSEAIARVPEAVVRAMDERVVTPIPGGGKSEATEEVATTPNQPLEQRRSTRWTPTGFMQMPVDGRAGARAGDDAGASSEGARAVLTGQVVATGGSGDARAGAEGHAPGVSGSDGAMVRSEGAAVGADGLGGVRGQSRGPEDDDAASSGGDGRAAKGADEAAARAGPARGERSARKASGSGEGEVKARAVRLADGKGAGKEPRLSKAEAAGPVPPVRVRPTTLAISGSIGDSAAGSTEPGGRAIVPINPPTGAPRPGAPEWVETSAPAQMKLQEAAWTGNMGVIVVALLLIAVIAGAWWIMPDPPPPRPTRSEAAPVVPLMEVAPAGASASQTNDVVAATVPAGEGAAGGVPVSFEVAPRAPQVIAAAVDVKPGEGGAAGAREPLVIAAVDVMPGEGGAAGARESQVIAAVDIKPAEARESQVIAAAVDVKPAEDEGGAEGAREPAASVDPLAVKRAEAQLRRLVEDFRPTFDRCLRHVLFGTKTYAIAVSLAIEPPRRALKVAELAKPSRSHARLPDSARDCVLGELRKLRAPASAPARIVHEFIAQ